VAFFADRIERGLSRDAAQLLGGDAVVAGGKFGPFDWVFKSPQRSSTAVERLFIHLQEKGLTKVALLTADDGFGKDGKQHLEAKAPDFGLSIVAAEVMDPAATDFSAQAFKLAVAQPQAVIVWTIGPAAAIAARNLADLPGEKPLVVQSHALPDPKFIELAGKAAEGVIMPGTKVLVADELPATDPQKPIIQKFIAGYKARNLEAKYPINAHSGYAYDTLLLIKEALTKAGKWVVLFFYPADFTFVCPTELADLAEQHAELQAMGCEVVSVSTDTKFTHLAWKNDERLLEKVKYKMAADPTGAVSKYFGVYDWDTGLDLRGTFIINPAGVLVGSEVNFYNVGRNAEELARKMKANTYLIGHPAEACPAKWTPGDKTLTPSEKLVGKVYEALNE